MILFKPPPDKEALPAVIKPYHIENRALWWRFGRVVAVLGLCVFLTIYGFYYALTTPWLLVPFLLPLGGLMLVIVWALPEMDTAPTRAIERLFFAFFVCLAWPNYLAIALPGLPWITLVRLTGFPLVLCLLISISVSARFRAELLNILQGAPVVWKAVATFAVLMTVSVALSREPMASIQKLIVGQVNWIAIFFISVYIFAKPGRVVRWAYVLWAMLLVISALAIWEFRVRHVVWASEIPSFLKIGDPMIAKFLTSAFRSATGEYRVKSTFSTPLGLAEFIALCLPFIMHFMLGPFSVKVRLIAIPTFFIAFFANVTTGSRLGMVGSLLGILIYTLIWATLRWRRNKMGIIGPSLLLAYPAFAVVLGAASFMIPRFRRSIWGGGATAASDATRAAQLEMGIPKIIQNPFGYGIGRGAETVGTRGGGGVLTIDNYYLSVAVEYGVFGFFLFYGLILAAIIYAVRAVIRTPCGRETSFLTPLAVALSSFFIIKWVFAQQDNHPLVFMMLGMIVALLWRLQKAENSAPDTPSPQPNRRSHQGARIA